MPLLTQWPTNTKAMQDLVKAVHSGQSARTRHTELIKSLPFSVAVQLAALTFKQQQFHGLAHHQQSRARGIIEVKGAVVCMGTRGRYRVDVQAFYLPSEDKFLEPMVIKNAYIVQDFSKMQKLEDEKKKKLLDARNEKQLAQASSKSVEDDHEASPKPAAGKEKE